MVFRRVSQINQRVVIILTVILMAAFFVDQAAAQGLTDPRFDLSNNGVVDDVDADMLLSAWATLQENGQCITSRWAGYDLNSDGCINVFDVQLLLTHWGERTRPASPDTGRGTTTFVVNSNADIPDLNPGDGQCNTGNTVTVSGSTSPECTLRAAIEESNNLSGMDIINFNIRNSNGSCPGITTIKLDALLPSIPLRIDDSTDAGVTIDGYSQCGASPNTQSVGGNANIRIQIEGVRQLDIDGLQVRSANNVVKGLSLYYSFMDISVRTSGAESNLIQGNIIGSNVNYNSGNYFYGIALEYGASNNTVGGPDPSHRNWVGKSSEDAFVLTGAGSPVEYNIVINNYIGVKQNGYSGAGNTADGMDISEGARYNWIGASPPSGWTPGDPPDPNRVYDPAERNVISKNGRDGIEISHWTGTQYNYIVNNYIGLRADGSAAAANGQKGVTIEDMPNRNYVYDNVISGNKLNGVRLYGIADYNEIVDNYIGVGPDGTTPMGNGTNTSAVIDERAGVYIYNAAQHVLVKKNIIANHTYHGVLITRQDGWNDSAYQAMGRNPNDTKYNTISQNSIYNNELDGIKLRSGSGGTANEGLAKPQITSALLPIVAGTACANCTVEVFIAAINDSKDITNGGEGKIFLVETTANGAGDFSVAVVGPTDGDKITTTATDSNGNTSQFSDNVEITNGETPVGWVLLNGGVNVVSAYSDVLAQFVAHDNVAVTHKRYKLDDPNLAAEPWTPISSPATDIAEEEVLRLSEGLHTIYAQYKDGDGNESSVYNASITVINAGDLANPTASVTINDGAPHTNDPDLALKLISPLYAAEMEIDDYSPGLDGNDWENYAIDRGWLVDDKDDGTKSFIYTIYAKFKDAEGNESSVVNDDILYDPVAPTINASIDLGTKALDLSGTADDSGGTGLAEMRFYNQLYLLQDTGWLPYGSSHIWPFPGGAEIVVQVKDVAGNEATLASPLIIPGPVLINFYLPIVIN